MLSSLAFVPPSQFSYYKILDNSLCDCPCHLLTGDIVECHLERGISTAYPHVLLVDGHTLIRYLHTDGSRIVLLSDEPPLCFYRFEIEIIGRIVRLYRHETWCEVSTANQPIPDFWLRWAMEETG